MRELGPRFWAEVYDGDNGWAIDGADGDPAHRDDRDAAALLDLLERQVIPLFYERDADGLPRGWLRRVKTSLRTLLSAFTAERMLRDSAATMYHIVSARRGRDRALQCGSAP